MKPNYLKMQAVFSFNPPRKFINDEKVSICCPSKGGVLLE
jgi:hypothetical protein